MEENEDYKVFGLYRKQSLIPAFIMIVVHSITAVYSIYSKVTFEQYAHMTSDEVNKLYLWYIHYPTLFIFFFLLSRYFDYFFRNKKYNRIYTFLTCMFVGWFFVVFLRIIFMVSFYHNEI